MRRADAERSEPLAKRSKSLAAAGHSGDIGIGIVPTLKSGATRPGGGNTAEVGVPTGAVVLVDSSVRAHNGRRLVAQQIAQRSGGAFTVVAASSAEQYLQHQQRAVPALTTQPACRPVTHLVLGGAATASEAAAAAARRRLGPALAAWGAGCAVLDEAWLTQLTCSHKLPDIGGFEVQQFRLSSAARAPAPALAAARVAPAAPVGVRAAAPAAMCPPTSVASVATTGRTAAPSETTAAAAAAAANSATAVLLPAAAPGRLLPLAAAPSLRAEGRFERWLGWWSPDLDGMDEVGVIMQARFNDARCAAVGNAHIAAGLRELKAFEWAVRSKDDEVGVRALAYARAAASVQACAFRITPDLAEGTIAQLLPFVDAACAAAIKQLAASGAAAAAAATGGPPVPGTPSTPYTPLSPPPDVPAAVGARQPPGQPAVAAVASAATAAAAAPAATPPRVAAGVASAASASLPESIRSHTPPSTTAATAPPATTSAAAAAAAAAMAGATCDRLEAFRRDLPVASSRCGLRLHTAGAATRRALTKLPGVGPSLAKLWYDAGIRSLAEAARRLEPDGGGLPGGRPPAGLQFALRHWADLTADVTAAEAAEMVAALHQALAAAASPRHLRKAAAAAAADAAATAAAAASGAGEPTAAGAAAATPQPAAAVAAAAAADGAGAAGGCGGGAAGMRTLAPGLTVGPTGWQVHCVGGGRRGRPSHDLDLMVCHPGLSSAEELSQLFEAALEHLVAAGRLLPLQGNLTRVQVRAMAGLAAKVQAELGRSRTAEELVGNPRSINDGLDHVFGVFVTGAGALKRLDLIFVLRPWLPHALVGWTGSTQFLRFLGQWAAGRGLHRTNHALYDRRTLQPVAGIEDEQGLFRALGLPYRPPEDRQCP
ncbi:hypothetical protein HYH02_000267 [Chlamydomonas schloesseri]|uniref:DNA polymerase beta thumb domain-containing protein n=1 Tax=Chlamydomonas schloesseri TaxID=2026947 RepID=A0A835WP26_9CHLO|nr:hypothetical protein HYH02_000267 [Chlamydomonas schloesseri]|eukprot:KAG2450165.1 hypothetical protein HYH02_000267 [Chlamydomonas schloesseri]